MRQGLSERRCHYLGRSPELPVSSMEKSVPRLGIILPFKKVFLDHRTETKKKEYRISSKICRDCRLSASCLGKSAKEKKFSVTYYREEYERIKERLQTQKGKRMKSKRQSTVEPPDSYRDWYPYPIYGFTKNKHDRHTTGQQGDASLSNSL